MRTEVQPPRQCGRRTRQPEAQRADQSTPDAFLRHSFEPLASVDRAISDQGVIETYFFKSLSYLVDLYQLPADAVHSSAPYPLNIAQVYEQAARLISQKHPGRKLIIIGDEARPATLATVEEMENYPTTLYYIPVKVYWDEMRKGKRPDRLCLLDAMFGYLLREQKVCYFTGEYGGYLAYQYDILLEQVTWEDETEEQEEYFKHIENLVNQIFKAGGKCLKRFNRPRVVDTFEKRLSRFQIRTPRDEQLKSLAERFLKLTSDFPGRSLGEFQGVFLDDEDHNGPQWDLSQTVSFFWTDDDETYEEISNGIDADFNDGVATPPKSIQLFDQPQSQVTHSFDFYHRLFPILEDFIIYLYKLDEEHNHALSAVLPTSEGPADLSED